MSTRNFIGVVLLGLLLLGTILYSTADYLSYFGLFFLALLGLFGMCWLTLTGLVGWEKFKGIKAERRVLEARARQAEYEAESKRYVSYQDGFGMIHLLNLATDIIENLSAFPGTHHNGTWAEPHPAAAAAWHALVGRSKSESPANLLPATTSQMIDLLPLLDRAERVLIKGASDAGKTTLEQHIATRSTNVIIVDPHYKPGLWPTSAKIVGAGRNFVEVSAFFEWLIAQLDLRYKQRATGNEDWIHYTIIIDEFMSINEECDKAGKILSAMIRESRKVGFRLFVGSHSELVEPLGLKGAGDVRDGLLIIRLDYNQITGERDATIDYGRGKRPCSFPPFYMPVSSGDAPELVIPDLVLSSQVSSREAKIIELIQAGADDRQIAREVFGKASLGGNNFYLVKELREKFTNYS